MSKEIRLPIKFSVIFNNYNFYGFRYIMYPENTLMLYLSKIYS